jgi:hypothetical protein
LQIAHKLSSPGCASGDAAATANNLLAHETAYRAGLGLVLMGNALYIALTVLLYRLLRPVTGASCAS